jgi:hypothetical protein
MSFSNKVKYTTSGTQRLDLDIQFGQGSISLRSTTVWKDYRQSTPDGPRAPFEASKNFMDATAISSFKINTNLSEMKNQRFSKNGKYLDFPYTGNTDEFSHVFPLVPSVHAGGESQ